VSRLVGLVLVPEYESLDIEPCPESRGLPYKRVIVTGSIRATVRGAFPVMINLYVNIMHAARGIGRVTHAVSGWEDVECRVGLWTVRILCPTVHRHESIIPVLLITITPLNIVDLDER